MIESIWFILSKDGFIEILKIIAFGNLILNLVIISWVFLIISSSAFFLGWLILFAINTVTSVMIKSYEEIKSNYSRDIDHLVSVNKNGLCIRENLD